MKFCGILLGFFLTGLMVHAQRLAPADVRFLKTKEDTLKRAALKIIEGGTLAERINADSLFTRALVRALRTPNSFYYPFDSVLNISKLYAPDSTFRIYTWQLVVNDNLVRQHGAIQMRTPDGSFKRFALSDRSDVTVNPTDTISSNEGWMGAVYYKIIRKEYKGHIYYTMLGFDANNIRSDIKVMDILEFVNGEPVFGNKMFVIANSNEYQKSMARFVLEYKKDAAPRLSYDPEMDAVVFDQLVSETGDVKKKWTLIPDGEYEGFRWINGKWVHVTNLFEGAPPKKYAAEKTIRNADGTINNSKLKGREEEQSIEP